MTQTYPQYEVWGLDNTPSDMDGGEGHHREDCFTWHEAKEARKEWQTGGRAAWILDKDTRKICYAQGMFFSAIE